MDDHRELIRTLASIDLATRIAVEGDQAGHHRSLFRGQGIEFAEIREYVPGDDVRAIDWKVSARYNRPFVKEYDEERDQTFYLVLDISGSGEFGSDVSKQRKITEVAAGLAFAAVRNNDRVGLLLISDRVEKFIPAKSGRKHLISLLNAIISHTPGSRKTDISAAAVFLFRILPRRCSIIMLSDFISPPFIRSLAILKRRHEVIAIRITDPCECELPNAGSIEIEDPETGEQLLIDTSDKEFRERYRTLVNETDLRLKTEFSKNRIGNIRLSTSEPYGPILNRFFAGLRGGRNSGRIF